MNRCVLQLLRVVCLFIVLGTTLHANCIDTSRLRGVNLSGAEFGHKSLPGVLNKHYVYPTRSDLAYFSATGMNLIRLPFRWERLQRELNGPLDPVELAQIRQIVAWGKDLNLCILLDLHNFGRYQARTLGSPELPTASFIDFWLRMHQAFPDPSTTAWGLMNEPSAISPPKWIEIAQEAVLAVRGSGAKHLLLVASGRWSGAHEWNRTFDGHSAANDFQQFQDPLNNFAIELHQYADTHFSGTETRCIDPGRLRSILSVVTRWALQEKKKLFLGEFGVANSKECLLALRAMLESMQNDEAWIGWSYWSAGAWWGAYPFSIQPALGQESLQTNVLRSFFPATAPRN